MTDKAALRRESNFSAFVRVFCDFARIEKAVNTADRKLTSDQSRKN